MPDWLAVLVESGTLPQWIIAAIVVVAALHYFGFWAWLAGVMPAVGGFFHRTGEVVAGERQASRAYERQMNQARFEAEQSDRALERSAQISVAEGLADLLRKDIEFSQAIIRHLLGMPEPSPEDSELLVRLHQLMQPEERDDEH